MCCFSMLKNNIRIKTNHEQQVKFQGTLAKLFVNKIIIVNYTFHKFLK